MPIIEQIGQQVGIRKKNLHQNRGKKIVSSETGSLKTKKGCSHEL